MKTLALKTVVTVMVALTAGSASATSFKLDISSADLTGTGVIFGTLNGDGSYTAETGSFTITSFPSQPNAQNMGMSLFAPANPGLQWTRIPGGSDVSVDNLLFPNSAAVVDYVGGVVFENASYGLYLSAWNQQPDQVMFVFVGGSDGTWKGMSGTATLTNVSDGGTTIALFGMALCGLGCARRRFVK